MKIPMGKAIDTILGTSIAPAAWVGLLIALVFEVACYLSAGRRDFWTPHKLMASALVAYLAYSLPAGEFRVPAFAMLVVGAAFAVYWLGSLRHWATDLAYLALVAAVTIAGLHKRVFTGPDSLPVAAIGQLLWFRLPLTSFLMNRPTDHVGFGFVPRLSEARTGLVVYLCCMPALVATMAVLGASSFRPAPDPWVRALATFVGIYFVVALFEEFFFRGLILPKLRSQWGTGPALVATSILFGLVHVRFGNRFPNWNMVVLASVAGLFFGWAYLRAGSIRAAMVTHALVVATWRAAFPLS
jgi:membrane protease YdiL (CAAX protease family)